MDEVLKIIIADDNYALVDFMKKILEEDKRFEVVGIATNDEEEIYHYFDCCFVSRDFERNPYFFTSQ